MPIKWESYRTLLSIVFEDDRIMLMLKAIVYVLMWGCGVWFCISYAFNSCFRERVCAVARKAACGLAVLVIPCVVVYFLVFTPVWAYVCGLAGKHADMLEASRAKILWGVLLLSAVIVLSVAVSVQRRRSRAKGISRAVKVDAGALSDKPICSAAEDLFHRMPFVNVLRDAILRVDVQNGAEYIGILGDWGAGKTSICNMLRCEMAKQKDPVLFTDLCALQFRNADDAVEFLQRSLAEVIDRNGYHEVADGFSDYSQMLRMRKTDMDHGSLGALLELLRWKFYWLFFSGRRYGIRLKRRLRLMGRRIVVVVDDLERLPADDVNMVLRLLKSSFDLPNVIFLFLADSDHLLMSASRFIGEDGALPRSRARVYLQKIMQYQFEIPTVPQSAVMIFFADTLDKMLKEFGLTPDDYKSNDGESYIPESAEYYIKNIRCAKILLNSVWESLTYMRNLGRPVNVHIVDFVALAAMRLIDPVFCSRIPQFMAKAIEDYGIRFYIGDWGSSEKDLSDWLTNNSEGEHLALIREFMAKRIGLEKSQDKNAATIYRLKGLQGQRQEYLSKYRLASPDSYREYFCDFSAVRYVPRNVMAEFRKRIAQGSGAAEILQKVRIGGAIPDFLHTVEGMAAFDDEKCTREYYKTLFTFARERFKSAEYSFQGLDGFPDNIYLAIYRCAVRYCSGCRAPAHGALDIADNRIYAGDLLYKAIEKTPECHLISRWLASEYNAYGLDKDTACHGFAVRSALFSVEQYEKLEGVYLDAIEKLQQEDELFDDIEFFDLMRGWNICLIHKSDPARYVSMRKLIKKNVGVASCAVQLLPFVSVSEVHLSQDIEINGTKFLPIDVEGAKRLLGVDLLKAISVTLEKNIAMLAPSQVLSCHALQYLIEHRFAEEKSSLECQVEAVKSMSIAKNE